MKYIITQEIESPAKLSKHFTAYDFFFILFWVALTFMLKGLVHPSLKIFYYIFSMLVGGFLASPSMWNKKRRTFQSIILFINRDIAIYKSLYFDKT